MKAIWLADLYGSRRSLHLFTLLSMLFMLLAISSAATVTSLTFALCASAGAGMLPAVNLEAAETSHWDRCVQAMPCTRAQAVSARYLEALAVVGAAWAYGAALFCAKAALGGWTWAEARLLDACVPAAGLLSAALCLAVTFRMGWARGKIVFSVTVCVVGGSGAATSLLGVSDAGLGPFAGSVAVLALPIAAVALFIGSWALSVRWYEKREL